MNMDKETYENMLKKSTSGNSSKNTPKRKDKVNYSRIKKSMIAMCCAGTIFGAVTVEGAHAISKSISENMDVSAAANDFKAQVISVNTHRTDDKQGYWYDYNEINNNINDDQDLYLCYLSMDRNYFNELLSNRDDFHSLDEYLEQHGYENEKDWKKQSFKKVALASEIENKQTELNLMQDDLSNQEVEANDVSNELGGI